MPVYNICSIPVSFPYEAYDCQIVYMTKVMQSLLQGGNGLLESPTGTGKTLCLLCASLAWQASLICAKKRREAELRKAVREGRGTVRQPSQGTEGGGVHLSQGSYESSQGSQGLGKQQEMKGRVGEWGEGGGIGCSSGSKGGSQKLRNGVGGNGLPGVGGGVGPPGAGMAEGGDFEEERIPTIIYASRTHAQLQQVVRELKATSYRPRMCILGSREHTCVHKKVSKLRGKTQSHTCRQLVKRRRCHHNLMAAEYVRMNPNKASEPHDIEDLVKLGRMEGPCPYYISRGFLEKAEIIFMPYNYVLDREYRKNLSALRLEGAVLIFDEAHNLERLLADQASVQLSTSLLSACAAEAAKCAAIATARVSFAPSSSQPPEGGDGGMGGGGKGGRGERGGRGGSKLFDFPMHAFVHGFAVAARAAAAGADGAGAAGGVAAAGCGLAGAGAGAGATIGGMPASAGGAWNKGRVVGGGEEVGVAFPGSYIYEFLAQLNITPATSLSLLSTVQHALVLLSDDAAALSPGEAEAGGAEAGGEREGGTEGGSGAGRGAGGGPAVSFRLEQLVTALQQIFPSGGPPSTSHSNSFKVCITERKVKAKKNASVAAPAVVRTLNWWCFDPGLVMQQIRALGVRSMLLTSGTLAPLQPYASELRVPFQQQLENAHVISQEQVWAGVLPVGPSGVALNSGFKTRSQHDYLHDMGSAIVNICRIVPGGVLVFFPSYSCMDSSLQAWQLPPAGRQDSAALSVWQRIGMHKQAVVEPKDSALLGQAREDYVRKLEEEGSKGAVLFAVCRGKVSEGIDFADNLSRAVVITGIPYAQQMSPQVVLKKEYLDERVTAQQHQLYKQPDAFTANSACISPVSGAQWYTLDAIRAVNQAVGRVIRHRNDFGSIILLDERFADPKLKDRLSMWIRPALKVYSGFGEAAFSLTKFFRNQPDAAQPKPVLPEPLSSNGTHSPSHVHAAGPMARHAAEAVAAAVSPAMEFISLLPPSRSLLESDPMLVPAANDVSAARHQSATAKAEGGRYEEKVREGGSTGEGGGIGTSGRRGDVGATDRKQAGGTEEAVEGNAGKNSRVPTFFSPSTLRQTPTSASSLLAAARGHTTNQCSPIAQQKATSQHQSTTQRHSTAQQNPTRVHTSPASLVVDLTQDCTATDPLSPTTVPPCCTPPVPSASPASLPPEGDEGSRETALGGGKRRRDESAELDGCTEGKGGVRRRGAGEVKVEDAGRMVGRKGAEGREQQGEAGRAIAGRGGAERGAERGAGRGAEGGGAVVAREERWRNCSSGAACAGAEAAPLRCASGSTHSRGCRTPEGNFEPTQKSPGPMQCARTRIGGCTTPEGFLGRRRKRGCEGNEGVEGQSSESVEISDPISNRGKVGDMMRQHGAATGTEESKELNKEMRNVERSRVSKETGKQAGGGTATREEKDRRAREYLNVVQTTLAPPDYQAFLRLLREFRANRGQNQQPSGQQQQQPVFSSASQPPAAAATVMLGSRTTATTRRDLLHSLALLFGASNQLPLLAGFDAFLCKQEDKAMLKQLLGNTAG
ncbi:hypothetical protein CLOP_g6403 [Closterium sp. NIES-67]|nr:hypothetical protein CLOP_g6403 [Closterium sp. NIES-67]